jgi:hypothetical protein
MDSPNLPIHLDGHVDVFFEHEGKQTLVHTSRRCPVCLDPLTGVIVRRASGGDVHAHCDRKLAAYQTHIPVILGEHIHG